jgi:hypothetical protein
MLARRLETRQGHWPSAPVELVVWTGLVRLRKLYELGVARWELSWWQPCSRCYLRLVPSCSSPLLIQSKTRLHPAARPPIAAGSTRASGAISSALRSHRRSSSPPNMSEAQTGKCSRWMDLPTMRSPTPRMPAAICRSGRWRKHSRIMRYFTRTPTSWANTASFSIAAHSKVQPSSSVRRL